MKKWLSIILAAGLLLYPLATLGIDYGSQTSQTQQAPPVAQTLVREGDFAIRLAIQLDLGKPENEAVAEEMLVKAGVAPINGWISDYPVTPEIIAQLKDSITKAADNGKLPMTSGEATKGLYYLTAQLNLPVPAGPGSSGTSPAAETNPTVINNYYYDEGPPIVTYYPPPADYLYLYDWVPFPVFWFGFWFPGFFICHSFTTVVFVNTPFVITNPVFVTRRAIVSNLIIDPVTRSVAVIDPVVRTRTGVVQPVTALRTSNGRMFSTVTDLRRGVSMSGVSAVRTGTTAGVSATKNGGFSSPNAQKSAQNIFTRNTQAMSVRKGSEGNMARGDRHFGASSSPARSSRSTIMRGTGESVRSFAAPHSPARPFNGPVPRGGHGPVRWFNGNGWHGRG